MPVEVVSKTIADTIQLRCSKAELEKMDPFIKTTYIEEKVPYRNYGVGDGMGSFYYMPYVTLDMTMQVPVERINRSRLESWLYTVVPV